MASEDEVRNSLQYLARRIYEAVGAELDENANSELHTILRRGARRATPDEFSKSVEHLAEALPRAILRVRMRRDTPFGQAITKSDVRAAMKGICPIWPFC
jgi:hypothetical protein